MSVIAARLGCCGPRALTYAIEPEAKSPRAFVPDVAGTALRADAVVTTVYPCALRLGHEVPPVGSEPRARTGSVVPVGMKYRYPPPSATSRSESMNWLAIRSSLSGW